VAGRLYNEAAHRERREKAEEVCVKGATEYRRLKGLARRPAAAATGDPT
jgi:hypothetical protein